ncbi:MAG: hypothetical protein KI790_12775 [Cyclobacteriaceae bacterium]|nr:hypothetical protein [Cyclobacteriaceae bacterium HetDA_MAG_MS6]
MKRIACFCSCLLLTCIGLAQVTNTGLPLAVSNGTTLTVSGGDFNSTGDITNEGTISMSQDVIITGSYAGNGQLTLNGDMQSIDANGASLSSLELLGGDKTLVSDLNITDLNFTSSRLITAGNRLEVSGTITGADISSHVVGRLIRSGASVLDFPVSDGTTYTPIVLSEIEGTSPKVGVEMTASATGGSPGFGTLALSENRFWNITNESGFGQAKVQIPLINETVAGQISEAVVGYSSTLPGVYVSLGVESSTGNLISGTLTSSSKAGEGFLVVARFFDEQLRVADSLALVSIYQNTTGASWNANAGWLSTSLDTWSGLTLAEKRVSEVALDGNNLQGDFPDILTGLESTSNLSLADNELQDVGDISGMLALADLDVSANRLQFGTIESLLASSAAVQYQNQKEVLEEVRTLQQTGSTYTADRTVTGSANNYTWFKDNTPISGSGPSVDVEIADFTDEGIFHAEVTNSNVPGLTLITQPINLRVSSLQRDSTSLLAFYNALGGSNWVAGDWPNLPISQWPGVIIQGERVTGLDLDGNNLTGEVPEDILDVEGLTNIDIASNNVVGLPDLNELSNVTLVNVSDNQLTFADLEPNVTVPGIVYGTQAAVGQGLFTTIDVGQDFDLSVETDGSANHYTWTRTNAALGQTVVGEDEPSLTINNIGYENMGDFQVAITNDLVPGLTLNANTQTVLAKADISFAPIYKDLDDNDTQLDEGEVYLFKINEPGVPYDTTVNAQLVTAEDVVLEDIILDNYLLLVRTDTLLLKATTDGRTDSVKLLPTYFESTFLWEEADTLFLRDFVEEALVMQQQPRPLAPIDDASIVGLDVFSDFADNEGARALARRRVRRAGCSLSKRRSSGRPEEDIYDLVAYKETDDNGRVTFENLPPDRYRLNIQYPGIPMDPNSFVEFEVGEGGMEDNRLELEATINEDRIVVELVEELGFYRKYFKDLTVFPVPADDRVTIKYGKLLSDNVQMKMVDLKGQVVHQGKMKKGYNMSTELDVSQVTGGVYLMYFYDPEKPNKNIVTYKMIVKH